MPKRKVKVIKTHVAGVGNDGNLYGVTSLTAKGPAGKGGYRRQVCATCPWRLDAPTGRFPAEAYRHSANTAYDASFHQFACHEAGVENQQTCAGFLRANADNNLGVRFAMMRGDHDPSTLRDDVPVYGSYRAMAIANGVAPDDPVLANCRGND